MIKKFKGGEFVSVNYPGWKNRRGTVVESVPSTDKQRGNHVRVRFFEGEFLFFETELERV